nr:hypothetical protein [uncultured Acetobacter sp.]
MSVGIDPAQSNGPLNVLIAGSAPGTQGVGIKSIAASVDGKSVVLTLTDGTMQTVSLPLVRIHCRSGSA